MLGGTIIIISGICQAIYAFNGLQKLGGTFWNCNYQKVKDLFDLGEAIS